MTLDNDKTFKRPPLEINTKTTDFFSTSNSSTPRPPPSISHKSSILLTTTPTIINKDEDNLFHYDSYANRLRNLVAAKLSFDDAPNTPKLQTPTTPMPPQTPIQDDMVGKDIESYRILKLLGIGSFSKVYLAQHNQQLFAMKIIPKTLLNQKIQYSIEREINILKDVNHPNIVHLETILETDEYKCIVLEYIEGGDLFDMLKSKKIEQDNVKQIFIKLIHAVRWLHEHHIVHRDLKLENILIHQEILKITDFGLAEVIDPDQPLLTTRCGSEEYTAPEIIQQKPYDGRKTDVWSLGIILYALLCGYLPFRYDPRKHESVSQLFYRILSADIKWPKDIQVSNEAKSVVSILLERDPQKRISIHEILDLPWFQH